MFYDNLKSLCDSKGLKISNAVVKCGGSTGSISQWRNGSSPSSDMVVKLSVLLNVTTDYLLLGKPITDTALLKTNEAELLNLFRMLSEKEQDRIIGRLENMVEDK